MNTIENDEMMQSATAYLNQDDSKSVTFAPPFREGKIHNDSSEIPPVFYSGSHDHGSTLPHNDSVSTWPSITKTHLIPKYNHIFTLFAALLLSTALAFLSALDAAVNCTRGLNVWSWEDFLPWLSREEDTLNDYYNYDGGRQLEENEMYYYNNYGDEGNYYDANQAEQCRDLFISATIPIYPIVILLSYICCRWTIDNNELKKQKDDQSSIPDNIYFSGELDRDRKRYEEFKEHVEHQSSHLTSCIKLCFLSLVCAMLCSYSKILIADESNAPRVDVDSQDLFKLRFQSLGALNYIGEVGQNANLYYSSWCSLAVSIALVYELGRITYKHFHVTKNLRHELDRITKYQFTQTNAVETVMTWSKSQQQVIKVKRSSWHEILYKLRHRTGLWLILLITSILIYTSSQRVWKNDIYPTALENGQIEEDGSVCSIVHGYISLKSRDDYGLIHPSKCERTRAAIATGIFCVCLSLFALLAHFIMSRKVTAQIKSSSKLLNDRETYRELLRKRRKFVPLHLEAMLSCVISFVLAINAIFCTAVEGPASRVGDLYYSSWIAFVCSMKLVLSCIKDIFEEDEEDIGVSGEEKDFVPREVTAKPPNQKFSRHGMARDFSLHTNFQVKEEVSMRLVMLSPTQSSDGDEDGTIGSYIGGMPIPEKNGLHQMFEERMVVEEEASRAKRVERWASGAIFSFVYLISVIDAAFHASYGKLDVAQLYMVICPAVFMTLCTMMFVLCLNKKTYEIVDRFSVGGIVAAFLLFIWMGNLVLTLHYESSWAVNDIGEIEMASMYYFTWLTIFNAGLLLSSYVKRLFPSKSKPLMVVLWAAVVKVCFVMFGSCCDILLTVKDSCQAAEHGDDTATFCERTIAGTIISSIGMALGSLAALVRFFHPNPRGTLQKAEAIMATFMAVLFAFSLALITGIGGPGKSVGDLYYGSWLAFLATLVVAMNLINEVRNSDDRELDILGSVGTFMDESKTMATPYSVI
ncbi:hypothetical protein CTEN210_12578 [Chaetoceros tenuissimus]|uniref:Uncharacterized protein n=1 Tax=Chaetoceros tenuissimus TaxID=426638 RepID=A0AAD3HA00_9STRA|nr:hypothetical protein CTEN210_12578 [Chaetoceros tenuissimus]